MTRILVTGGAGFLGGWILKALTAQGHEIRIFDRATDRRILHEIAGEKADHVDFFRGDITDAAAVAKAAKDCTSIIHLAAVLTPACKSDPVLGATVNLIGTLNVFEAAKANGIRRVAYASSAAIFGPHDGTLPCPVTQYGAFKLACEGSARAYWHDASIASIGLRPTVVYGPGRESGLTAGPTIACREAVAGRAYTIGYSGPQDLVFVADVAAGFAAAATREFEGAHACSLGGAREDVPDVIAAIEAEVPGAKIDFAGPGVPMAPDISQTDNTALLGPLPFTPLRKGISQTVSHYRSMIAGS